MLNNFRIFLQLTHIIGREPIYLKGWNTHSSVPKHSARTIAWSEHKRAHTLTHNICYKYIYGSIANVSTYNTQADARMCVCEKAREFISRACYRYHEEREPTQVTYSCNEQKNVIAVVSQRERGHTNQNLYSFMWFSNASCLSLMQLCNSDNFIYLYTQIDQCLIII